MKPRLKKAFDTKINSAVTLINLKKFDEAFFFLEEAHILGQRHAIPHTITHLYMLQIAIKKRSLKEVLGQLFRIPTGFIGSLIGIFPTGNTGGSNISPFKKIKIPEHLRRLMD